MDVKITGPYNYLHVIERLSYDPIRVIDKEKNGVMVPINVYGKDVVASVAFSGPIENPNCHIQLPSGYEEEGIRKIITIFQLEESLQEIANHFLHTDLAKFFRVNPGLPLLCEFDLYYCVMKTIIHQQLNLSFAHTLTERFVKSFGKDQDGVWFPPTPETVSNLDYEDLRKLQFSQRKAEYVIDTSKLIASGELNLDELKLLKDEEAIEQLVKIRGIGYWTAENILLFGMARKNLFPVKDIGIQNAVKNLFELEKKPTVEELLTMSEQWSPYKSYASLYLWESLGNQKARS
ncbi:DNA-3-methyladenine glycosylase [Anaerobacillus alkalidiazotrophicus]|uniref:DNA-3-methyladenine glycosylase II n=1 Tax=Anaerobacillus alkalidiazotrophicus TaxID=472963 RepID=A0A1S2M9S0_9BACI|nr:DNA-3-methyladenine glycosylase [Anaerobacillus alkalidiazotrophicus]OIJ21300.1 DNA-3-methyladenine glycosylase [Anaerobacillus alkalidiazotrophicus]